MCGYLHIGPAAAAQFPNAISCVGSIHYSIYTADLPPWGRKRTWELEIWFVCPPVPRVRRPPAVGAHFNFANTRRLERERERGREREREREKGLLNEIESRVFIRRRRFLTVAGSGNSKPTFLALPHYAAATILLALKCSL
jgi:hypothetical protein